KPGRKTGFQESRGSNDFVLELPPRTRTIAEIEPSETARPGPASRQGKPPRISSTKVFQESVVSLPRLPSLFGGLVAALVALTLPPPPPPAQGKKKTKKTPAPAGEPTATPVERIKVKKDFRVELLYSVPRDKQGSWVSMTVDHKGRLITSDQGGRKD